MTTKNNTNSIIGKHISKIPNRHKPYFDIDENNIVTGYKRLVSIDKMHLKARFSQKEMDYIADRFTYYIQQESLPNGFILTYFIVDLVAEFGVYIKLQPHIKGINAEIQLHSKFTTNLIGNSPIIIDILNNPKWFVTRLDVATDYVAPFTTSAYLRSHGNKKQENYDTSSWAGSGKNPNKKVLDSHYDRDAKYNMLDTNFSNRFEVKLFFNQKDNMKLANLNHGLIVERLKKEMFIPCLTYSYFHDRTVKTSIGDEGYIELIKKAKEKDNENYIKTLLTESQWKTFRSNFKASRDDIEQAYINLQYLIYDFLI